MTKKSSGTKMAQKTFGANALSWANGQLETAKEEQHIVESNLSAFEVLGMVEFLKGIVSELKQEHYEAQEEAAARAEGKIDTVILPW